MQYAADYHRRSRPQDPPRFWVMYQHLGRPDEVVSRHHTIQAAEKKRAQLQRDFEKQYPPSHGVHYLCGWYIKEAE